INTAPVITTQPIASQTVCEGGVNTTFSVVATGTGLTYQWKKNGVDIGGATSTSYIIPTAATGDAGTYTVQVSGTCAPSVTSTGSALNINEQPEIITVTGNQTVCEGASVTFTVNAGATTSPTYQWRFNTTPIAGATNSSYTIPTTTTGDAGSYDVVVSGACTPSATSAASTLTINTSPAITTQPIASQTVCEGTANVTFNVVATGTGLTYQWKKNGVNIVGATSTTFTIPTAATGDAGTYTVQVSGTCAPSVTSTGSALNINEQPEIITVTGNQTVCEGASVTFTVNAGVTTSPTYQWRFNTTPIAGATNSSYTIPTTTTGDAGNYDVVVSGACTPSATSAASILTINTAPVITTQPIASQTVCEGTANVTFSVVATGTSLTYQWKKNGVDIGGATSTSYIIPTAATGDAGTYTVQVSGTCAPSVTSTGSALNINEQPEIITVTGNQTVCAGASVTFTVNAGVTTSPTYQWRFNTTPIAGATNSSYTIPTTAVGDAGSYDVVVSGTCTPSATSAASILTINELPEVTLNPSNSTICENGSTSFTVNSGTTTSPTFQWQVSTNGGLTYSNLTDGGIYSGSTSNTLALTNVPLSQNGNLYKVIIGGACPPTAVSSVAQLNVQQNPVIVDQPTNKIVCENTIVLFSVNSVGTGLNYQWRENGTPITNGGIYSGATTANLSLANIPATLNGNGYDVVITGTCSTTTSSLATLNVNPLPIGVNEAITICSDIALNYDLQTNINSSNGVVSTYSWVASNNLNVLGESLGIQSSSAITDKLTNQSVSSQIVTYTITPTSVTGSCQGTPFTLTVTINPESVGISQNVIQCSGVPSGITITSTAGSVTPSGFNIATNPNGLTQLAGTISAGLNQSATELHDDVWSNTGASPVNVIYTITPIGSLGGCLGDPFTITLTVSPEPVGVSQTHTVCSDAVLGSGLTLSTNGTSVSAASYTINSITFSSGTLTASAGVPVTG
ncbi:MAG: immunoglobulin domain-containing protein, partial [Cyclobacteriaceae bacterium]